MSREVCGICWCPYDDDTGECACEPEPKAQHMTDLRTAAQQALKALEEVQKYGTTTEWFDERISALRAALAEPVQEPVALAWSNLEGTKFVGNGEKWKHKDCVVPLYTAPQR